MVSKDIKYFEWSDIQSEICKDTISRNDLMMRLTKWQILTSRKNNRKK